MKTVVLGFVQLMVAVLGSAAVGAESPTLWREMEALVNYEASYMVCVDVDQPLRVYRDGEPITVTVRAERTCYVYIIHYGGEGATLLFPHARGRENLLAAHSDLRLSHANGRLRWRAAAPLGRGVLQVVASSTKLTALDKGSDDKFPALDADELKRLAAELRAQKPDAWAEARIDVTTVEKDAKLPPSGKRYAVVIGVSQYQHDRIEDLNFAHLDAERVREWLRGKCGFKATLLTNEQATREHIEQAIFSDLVQKSRPGDTVLIYFSGKGGRMKDLGGDEPDGFDEYFAPNDNFLGRADMMIVDDRFCRWLQDLAGRQIVVILDTCHVGPSRRLRSADAPLSKGILSSRNEEEVDGMEIELQRLRRLGHHNIVMLTASSPSQNAWEIPKYQGGALTHYLLKSLDVAESDRDGNGELSAHEAFLFTQQQVELHMRDELSFDQTPDIVNDAPDVVLRMQMP